MRIVWLYGMVIASDGQICVAVLHVMLYVRWKFDRYQIEKFEPVHEISNNVVCVTSKASDRTAHTRSLIRAFPSRLSIL